jgi:hypothetical protein
MPGRARPAPHNEHQERQAEGSPGHGRGQLDPGNEVRRAGPRLVLVLLK